jgi:hypothetical protein
MKHLFEITLKEKQMQTDQLQHERQCNLFLVNYFSKSIFLFQVFHNENDTLKQLVIRDGHDKQAMQFNINTLQHLSKNTYTVKPFFFFRVDFY